MVLITVHEAGPIANRSIKWIMLFSDLFSMPETFDCQIQFGKKFFKRFINRITKEYPFMKDEYEISHVDLAMCILLSHSVNAPSVAYNLLCQSFNTKSESSIHWAKKLIRLLGTSKYGRWDDDIKNGRYQRTRTYAQKSGFWPDFHFNDDGIMPKDIIE
ncbi:MAG: hypothetical protein BV456_07595 [Thermoplasmata archaeon M8B2D]|nr:MAG: hypothetical protein BV456_07595 [Thermoplasmata archaeon M8B2D]